MPCTKEALDLYEDAGVVYGVPANTPLQLPPTWAYRPDDRVPAGSDVSKPQLLPSARASVIVPGRGRIIVQDASLDWTRELAAASAMRSVLTRAARDLGTAIAGFDLRKDLVNEIEQGTWAVLGDDNESVVVHAGGLTTLDAKSDSGFVPFAIDGAGKDASLLSQRQLVQQARSTLLGMKAANPE